MEYYQGYNFFPQNYFYPPFQLMLPPEVQPMDYAPIVNYSPMPFMLQNQCFGNYGQGETDSKDAKDDNDDVAIQLSPINEAEEIHTQKTSVKYAKKNAQSNIINQIFSFLSLRSKSERVLTRIFQSNAAKVNCFYKLMKRIKHGNKKYINRCYLRRLIEMDFDPATQSALDKFEERDLLSMEEIRRALRVLLNFYIREVCVCTILSSSKLDRESVAEHLRRRKEVYCFIENHLKLGR